MERVFVEESNASHYYNENQYVWNYCYCCVDGWDFATDTLAKPHRTTIESEKTQIQILNKVPKHAII